ncbi:MAG: symmetrical bis(5'-nucleosyl)-tetraphosphatase [Acidiferrobacterales bacterium]
MSVFAIGDVQGCFDALQALLARIRFDPSGDRLWFTGDLVNRGPQSADVVRLVMGLGKRAISVLGNHDLHLLAVAAGNTRLGRHDTLRDVLEADDRQQLLGWLRRRPLLHHDAALGLTLVHAGLLPEWDLAKAQTLAREVETVLRGPDYCQFLNRMYGNRPDRWEESLTGWDRWRLIVNAFTRLRYCDPNGRMNLAPVGAPGSQPDHLVPWFQVPTRRSRESTIIFGHWSTLGVWREDGVIALDTGCLWGGSLTAVKLNSGELEFFSVPCAQAQTPE